MRNKDENKEAIIREKAIKMIVAEGFDGLSMKKLAKSAGISVSTIYIYFKNRADLLNTLYREIEQKFENVALKDFNPNLPFKNALWLQWKNNYKNIVKNPTEFYFLEQFRNSPLANYNGIKEDTYKKKMTQFVQHATSKNEITNLPEEIFWALAYGPFYMLIKFHLNRSTMAEKPFSLDKKQLKQTFKCVMRSLKS